VTFRLVGVYGFTGRGPFQAGTAEQLQWSWREVGGGLAVDGAAADQHAQKSHSPDPTAASRRLRVRDSRAGDRLRG
jgi:hypothetical protein